MKNLEKKCRIQLYDAEFNQISDRLVAQDVEFRSGPKEVHLSPLRIELSLFDREDLVGALEYLNRLSSMLPLEKPKGVRGRKPTGRKVPLDNRQDLAKALSATKDPKEFIKIAREHGFVASTPAYLKDLGYQIKIPALVSNERWTMMVMLTKKAKNPLNSKYDPITLIFVREDKAIISIDGEVASKIALSSSVGDRVVVPAKAKMKFPHFLTLEERNQFRLDMDKLKDDPQEKPTRLYVRWVHDVALLNPEFKNDLPKLSEIPNPYE